MQQKRRSDWKRYEKIAIRLESGFLNKRFVNVTMVDVVFCFLFFLADVRFLFPPGNLT
jgi:hypothetical protein